MQRIGEAQIHLKTTPIEAKTKNKNSLVMFLPNGLVNSPCEQYQSLPELSGKEFLGFKNHFCLSLVGGFFII